MSKVTVIMVPIDSLEPNKWNANVVSPEDFQNLKAEMKHAGNLSFWDEPHAAIVVSSHVNFYGKPSSEKEIRFVIVDGFHRWKAAQELGWEEVGVEVTAKTEEQAQQYAYQVNKNRGTLDPLKEAELFKRDVDRKMTAAQIADKYGPLSESYVKSRLQLLKISPTVKHLYEKPAEAWKPAKVDELAHEMRSEEEKDLEPSEDLRKMAEGRVEKVVPRGTLTGSHLEAIASLPEEYQKKISLKIIEDDMNVRQTEQKVSEAKGEIRAHNKFVKALDEAVQKTCPKCGSPPEDWKENPWMTQRGAEQDTFGCSRRGCYEWWDPSVKAKPPSKENMNAEEREAERRAERMKEGRENPAYIILDTMPKQLHERTGPWLVSKVREFTEITSLQIKGKRGKEPVVLNYNPPSPIGYGRYDLTFIGAQGEFKVNVEEKEYKREKGKKSKVYLTQGNGSPALRARGRLFFAETLTSSKDPFLPMNREELRLVMETYGEKPVDGIDVPCPRGLKVLSDKSYETCIEAVKKECPAELQAICKGRCGKVNVDAEPPEEV